MSILSIYLTGFLLLAFLTYITLLCKKRIEYIKLLRSLSTVPSNIAIATQVNIEPETVIVQLPDPELLVLPVINE